MLTLIITVLLSLTLIVIMVFFRIYKLNFWLAIMESQFIQKIDSFLENIFKILKKKSKISFNLIRKILMNLLIKGNEFVIWTKKISNKIFKKIIKKTNGQINKLDSQKVIKAPSDYLKNIEEYKNGREEREEF